jgi:hypothetical protein
LDWLRTVELISSEERSARESLECTGDLVKTCEPAYPVVGRRDATGAL